MAMGVGEPLSSLRVELPARPASVAAARCWVLDALRGVGVDRFALALLVSEAVSNAVIHGYADRTPGPVWGRACVGADHVDLEVADDGHGTPPRRDSPGAGLGTPVMSALA